VTRAIVALLVTGTISIACRPTASHKDVHVARPTFVADTTGHYRIQIDRRVDARRAFALEAAESYAPPRKNVRAAARHARSWEKTVVEPGQWWYDDFDGTRLPFALTGDALGYYLALITDIGAHAGKTPGRIPMISAEFRYAARVLRADSVALQPGRPREGFVVELDMYWSQYCGDLCSLSFDKHRRVWVAEDGRVLAVEGDGLTQGLVSWRQVTPAATIAERSARPTQ
jgi:hypothetical protein